MVGPVATYRLQLTPSFGFADAARLVPHLADLGVSHLYLSPAFEAVPGSEHGYDVTDPGRLREELGGEAAFRALAGAAAVAGLGLLLDVVPNHVAAHEANPWWWEVLELGRAAPHAGHLDIDWDPPERRLRGQVALAVLGDRYGRVLASGDLRLVREGHPVLRWPGGRLPLSPATVGALVAEVGGRVGDADLRALGEALAATPGDVRPLVGLARELLDGRPGAAAALDDLLAEISADPSRLHEVLAAQPYELMRWQRSAEDLDYRRFFDVAGLVGVHLERPEVFDAVLGPAVALHREGLVDGLRLDHVDGLADPVGAVRRLAAQAPSAWLLVEKVLTGEEALPDGWPVAGTTGYETMARLTGVQADPTGVAALQAAWREATGVTGALHDEEVRCRRLVLDTALRAEVRRLVLLFARACEDDLVARDSTRRELAGALVAAAVATPAYRSYGRAGEPLGPDDAAAIDRQLARAAELDPSVDPALWARLRQALRFEVPGAGEELAVRFQQLCGPVAAKGDEDTLAYRWTAWAGSAEVGHPLSRPTVDVGAFHAWCAHVQDRWPRQLTSLTTHDTKRSEDVRARLCVLAQDPAPFLALWPDLVARHGTGPDPALAWLLAQVALAAHPISADRLAAYALKAAREAKAVTSWLDPDLDAEAEVDRLARALAEDPAVAAVHARLRPAFEAQGLAQKALQLLVPGVPDLYQGAELWDLRLVDPDNRTPVDHDERRRLLAEGGHPKLDLVRALLAVRRRHPAAFGPGVGTYRPLDGPDGVVAFVRADEVAVAVARFAARPAPELPAPPGGGWCPALSRPGIAVWERG